MASIIAELPIYRPLQRDEIRILVLHPGTENDPINCNLIDTTINSEDEEIHSRSEYEALSYMWGSPEHTEDITIDGHTTEIRYNLWLALKSIRDKETACNIWVDALCINQIDMLERNAQVLRMSKIYKNASKVIVWLGKESDDSDAIFDFMGGDRKRIRGFMKELVEGQRYSDFEGGYILKHTLKAALLALCYREYWRRVWIIQEIMSASQLEILCGTKSLPWQKFDEILAYFGSPELPRFSYTEFGTTCQKSPAFLIVGYKRGKKGGNTLKDLIQLCFDCHSECQDVRDRIYGLLSVASDDINVTPDYSKTTLQVFYDLLEWAIPFSNDSSSTERSSNAILYSDRRLNYHSEWIEFVQVLLRMLGNPLHGAYLNSLDIPIRLRTVVDRVFYFSVNGIIEHINSEAYQYGVVPELDFDNPQKQRRTLQATLREREVTRLGGNAELLKHQKYKEDQASLGRLSTQDYEVIHCIGKRYYPSDIEISEAAGSPGEVPTTGSIPIFKSPRGAQNPLAIYLLEDKTYSHPNRDTRQYRTFFTQGLWGIASHEIQTGDYIYSSQTIEGLRLVVRPQEESKNKSSYLIISRALILRDQGAYSEKFGPPLQIRMDLSTLLPLLS